MTAFTDPKRTLLLLGLCLALGACGGMPVKMPDVPFSGKKTAPAPESKDSTGSDAPAEASDNEQTVVLSPADRVKTPRIKAGNQQAFEQGVALLAAGDLDAAQAQFELVTASQPKLAGPWVNLGLIAQQQGDQEAALAHFDAALKANRYSCDAWNAKGIVLRQLGRFEQAEAAYQACIAADPKFADARLNLGILYELYMGDYPQALVAYQGYQQTLNTQDQRLAMWIADLERRAAALAQR